MRFVMDTYTGWAVVYLCLLLRAAAACDFPYFMQSNGTDREWASKVRDQYSEFTLQVQVDRHVLRVTSTDSTAKSFTRACLRAMGDHKFIVAHEEHGQTRSKYTCIQFVRRGVNVIQLKTSDLGDRMDTALCNDDRLAFDPWLIVDKSRMGIESPQGCPLKGGFSIRIFDKMNNKGVCDDYNGETRLESECVRGDGLTFYFRNQNCIPGDLYMYTTQRCACVADWVEGPYTFMLLRHETLGNMWVMRYPTVHGESFVTFLFKDLVGESRGRIEVTNNYVRLDSVRDPARPVNSLCVDDYEVCSYWSQPCNSGPQMALTCPRTCKLCSASRPVVCQFRPEVRGTWYDGSHTGTLALTVNATVLATHEDHLEEFHCIRWDNPSTRDRGREIYTEMLVKEFHNGCKPRYSCVQFQQKGSSVMFTKVSLSRSWPFTNTLDEPVDCSSFDYDRQKNNMHVNKFRNKHFRLLYNRSSNHALPCHLPANLQNYFVTFRDGTECTANILESHAGTGISINFTHCPKSNSIETMYTCLDTSALPSGDLLIVSRTPVQPAQLQCWFFPKRPRGTFYLLESTHCDERANRRIKKERLRPLVRFSKNRSQVYVKPEATSRSGSGSDRGFTRRPLPDKPRSTDRSINTGGYQLLPPGTPGNNSNKSIVRTPLANTTQVDSDVIRSTSPLVVIAAVLFFAVFQIPCLCKGSS